MGNKAKKVGKNRQDKFYHLAKEQGFRSRASFKLVQLNKRHDFLSTAARGVIDLCAAPGGWTQVARKHMPVNAPCIGIDLVPIRPVPGCTGLQGDITSDHTRSQLKQALRQAGGQGKVDAVLNDGSPNMGKAWLQDAYTQSELTLAALKLASEFLAPGGTFVTKVFRSNDYNSLLFVMNQLFERVNATKPSASRAESAEIYVLCSAFKAPKHIDPRLLNPKHVFKDLTEAPHDDQKPDLILNTVMKNMKRAKRNRAGYEEGKLTMFSRVSILRFCRSPRPVAMMVENSQISFDIHDVRSDSSEEDAHRIIILLNNMSETTEDVKHCFQDLKVLARRDFKLILKWRLAARQKLQEAGLLDKILDDTPGGDPLAGKEALLSKPDNLSSSADQDSKQEEEFTDSDEEALSEEMKNARAERIAKEKRKRRKLNKVRAATQRKIDMKIILPEENIGNDGADPHGLFSINTASSMLDRVSAIDGTPDVNRKDGYESEVEDVAGVQLPYQIKAAEESKNEIIEEDLDRWYKVYLSRKKRDKNGVLLETKEKKRQTKRRALREALAAESGKTNDLQEKTVAVNSSESSESEIEEDHDTALPKGSMSREAALWFAQPVFEGIDVSSDEEATGVNDKATENNGIASPVENEGDVTDSFHRAALKEAKAMAEQSEEKAAGEGFDVVPMEGDAIKSNAADSASDTESFHSSDYDTDEKAEMVAIAKKMHQSKKVSNDILDEAYHRYTFDDPEDLPRWFADPDPAYRRRQAPVTKEQVTEMKEYIKSLQTAPTKKEAEAKARRRARAAKKMEAVKAKATSIAEQGDVPASSRMKAIEGLYKQALKSGKGGKKGTRKVYQVVRPNGRMAVGKGIGKGRKGMRGARATLVDKRLKADKRGLAKAQKRSKKKTR